MNVVDSSGWLGYLADETNAAFFAPAIENVAELVVPSLSVYEVFKRILQQRSEDLALQAVRRHATGQSRRSLDVALAESGQTQYHPWTASGR